MQIDIIDHIIKIAIDNPKREAVLDRSRVYTYKDVIDVASQIARYLSAQVVSAEDVVGIRMDRSYSSICATLGVMMSGAAFLPIDKNIPYERVCYMCDTANVKVVLSDTSDIPIDKRFVNINLLKYSYFESIANNEYICNNFGINQLAYVIFTSGSTGMPKGVMIEYAGMQNHLYEKVRILSMNENTVVAFNASISFDISVWQMLSPLLVGGKVVVFSNEEIIHVSGFCRKLIEHKVTLLELVPTYLNLLIDECRRLNTSLINLEKIISTGEELTKYTVERWFDVFKFIPIINAYGPTEASDDVTHCVITSSNQYEVIPIGAPIKNVKLLIKDENNNTCGIDEKGELVIIGICVGRGYIGDNQETEKYFYLDSEINNREYKTGDIVSRQKDGNLIFWGRVDRQIKIQGNRIELSEIEYAITKCNANIIQTAVFFDDVSERIKACYTASKMVSSSDVRSFVESVLPDYMVPSEIIQISAMPVNTNGKIDNKLLHKHFKHEINSKINNYKKLDLEEEIMNFMSELLKKPLPNDSNWKDDIQTIGFNSILIIKLIIRIEEEYNFEFVDEDVISKTVYNFNNLIDSIRKAVKF